jgi:hypothetical protein
MTPDRGSIAGALLFGLLVFSQLACGDDDGDDTPGPAATCSGEGCTCDASNECICTNGGDCKTTCEQCSLTCEASTKCNAEASGAVVIECNDNAECKGNGGNGSTLTCQESSNCNLKAGEDSVVTCAGSSDCKINVGPGSTIECKDSAHCDIKCDAGDCEVTCGSRTQCALSCGEKDGKPGTECPDGRQICGIDC